MTAIIIEDEIPAGKRLERLLLSYNFKVLIVLKSVKNSIIWLNENNHPDIVFIDIKLGDGNCFDILNKVEINSKIVFTTAFDEFALNAFNFNAIDYLLKPIDELKIEKLLEKIDVLRVGFHNEINWKNFSEPIYEKSFLINVGLKLKKIVTEDIVYFFSENNSTYIFTKDKRQYLIHKSLDNLENEINPTHFFRINRKYILNKSYIKEIIKTNQLQIILINNPNETFKISRLRVKKFLKWYE